MPFTVVKSGADLVVKARATPRTAITITTAGIAVVFVGFAWVIAVKAPESLWAPIVIGMLTTIGTPLGIVAYHRHEQKRGPVLVWNGAERMLELPRLSTRLSLQEIGALALVTAHDGSSDWASQIQVHTKRGDRLPVITAFTRRELESMAQTVSACASIPFRSFNQVSKFSLREDDSNN